MKTLLSKIDSADIGLVLIGGGAALFHLGAGLIVVGVVLILQVRPLRMWL